MMSQVNNIKQKELENRNLIISEIRYRRLFEAARDGILILDVASRKIVDANPFMTELMGFSKEELLGKELWEIGLLKDAEASQTAFLKLEREGYIRYEHLPFQTKGGKHWDVECVCNIYQEDNQQVIQCNIRDITQRKLAEAELEKLMIREKALRLEAEEATRTKDLFLAIISHELRTPLNAIVGWTYLLRTGRMDDKGQTRALEVIERNANLQTRLIDDLLDSSRIIAGHLRIHSGPLDLRTIINLAVDSTRTVAHDKFIQIRSHLDSDVGQVSGDPSRLQQVITNLLSNAVKFTPNGGSVEVLLERVNSDARITVTDTGIGFSNDFLPHAFDLFRQADSSSTRSQNGLGLGLTIARKIIDMHGGTLRAENREDKQGASLILSLPLIEIDNENSQLSGSQPNERSNDEDFPPEIAGLRILIVDDEPASLEMLETLLNHWGAKVRTSDSALAALELLQQWKPDMLLSDIAMPERDGNWLIANIRKIENTNGGRIPAIAVTAYLSVEDREGILAMGYDGIVSKPIKPSQLLTAISRLTKNSRTEGIGRNPATGLG
ncbi:MAG TPA: ATP-binding protein, partial [Blastocatellia bacterium]|nr:ATP-binding protein [Blastocatellia bacterium]